MGVRCSNLRENSTPARLVWSGRSKPLFNPLSTRCPMTQSLHPNCSPQDFDQILEFYLLPRDVGQQPLGIIHRYFQEPEFRRGWANTCKVFYNTQQKKQQQNKTTEQELKSGVAGKLGGGAENVQAKTAAAKKVLQTFFLIRLLRCLWADSQSGREAEVLLCKQIRTCTHLNCFYFCCYRMRLSGCLLVLRADEHKLYATSSSSSTWRYRDKIGPPTCSTLWTTLAACTRLVDGV